MTPEAWTFAGTVVITSGAWVGILLQNRRHHAENRASQATLHERTLQLTPNHGSHLADDVRASASALVRVEQAVTGLRQDVGEVRERVAVNEAMSDAERRQIRHGMKNLNAALLQHMELGHDQKETA